MARYLVLLFFALLPFAQANLKIGFYSKTCRKAEAIVTGIVTSHFQMDPSITGAFLRLFFHDCAVKGCDASVMIEPTPQNSTERSVDANLTLRGFEILNEIKAALEAQCPLIVSCADTLALATRDSIVLAGGPQFQMPTGRKDSLVSNPRNVKLPGPRIQVAQATQFFATKGLTVEEMVILFGAHTVGFAHCSFFSDRLSNFRGTGSPDQSMDLALRDDLKSLCSSGSDPRTFLDQNTSFAFDNVFYRQVMNKKGILQIDQELSDDSSTAEIVTGLAANNSMFMEKFAAALVTLGSIKGSGAGNIRKTCTVFN